MSARERADKAISTLLGSRDDRWDGLTGGLVGSTVVSLFSSLWISAGILLALALLTLPARVIDQRRQKTDARAVAIPGSER